MYRWIWSKLPGRVFVKALTSSLLGLVLVGLLFTVVFPWVELSFFAPPTVSG